MADRRAAHRRHVRIAVDDYRRWTADLPAALMDDVTEAWGEAPGRLFVNDQRRDRARHDHGRATSCC